MSTFTVSSDHGRGGGQRRKREEIREHSDLVEQFKSARIVLPEADKRTFNLAVSDYLREDHDSAAGRMEELAETYPDIEAIQHNLTIFERNTR